MNIAEVLLRLGCSLVAWLVIFTHTIWLATLRVTGCGADGDQFWRLLLGFAVVAAGMSFLTRSTQRLAAVHQMLRWAIVPAAVFAVLCLPPVWQALSQTTLGGAPLCGDPPAPAWHVWWAPVQLLSLGIMAWNAWQAFRKTL